MVNTSGQSSKYLLTINNPTEKGYTHEEIMRILTTNFKTFRYACMADEKCGTLHTHAFVCFTSRIRFSMIKKYFPEAHIDQIRGTVSQTIAYISKSGKWADTEKAKTRIAGTFEEFGTRPADNRGKHGTMPDLYDMIEAGMSNAEILAANHEYLFQQDKLDKLRSTILADKADGTERLNLKCVYVCGPPRTGKSRDILLRHGYKSVYRVTDYMHPFDGYASQPVLCFEEFQSGLKLTDMLSYCDIYPVELPARYSNKYACYNTVYIVSNWPLEKQYSEMRRNPDEGSQNTWKAFLRRIHEVHVYENPGRVTIYSSVDDYMKSIAYNSCP